MWLCCIGSQSCNSAVQFIIEPENFIPSWTNIGLIVDISSQAGLPLIKAGIEEAWLEGRGELTDDQVGIFDKVQSITFPFSGDWFELVSLTAFLKKSLKLSSFYLVQLVDYSFCFLDWGLAFTTCKKFLTVPKTLCRWRQLLNGNWAWRQSRGDKLQNRQI